MAFTVKDWKDRPAALNPLSGETPAEWETRAAAYIAANPSLVTVIDASAMEDLETRLGVYTDSESATRIPSSLLDAKGDLIAASADNTAGRLPAGSNNQVLTADSTVSAGVKWSAAPGGGIPATIVDVKGDIVAATAADT